MKLLLDTHVWLWALLEPERLGRRLVRRLKTVQTELHLSPISLWEALRLAQDGRVDLGDDAKAWIEEAQARAPIRDAPLTQEVVLEGTHVVLRHRDPADHLLAATARAYDLTLATADRRLLAGKGYASMDAHAKS